MKGRLLRIGLSAVVLCGVGLVAFWSGRLTAPAARFETGAPTAEGDELAAAWSDFIRAQEESIALLRAIGPTGALFSYERRPAAIAQGRANVRRFLGAEAPHQIVEGDVYEGFSERALDRVVLDLPEPWRLLPAAAEALVDGGILIAYLPTALQVHQQPGKGTVQEKPQRTLPLEQPETPNQVRL